MPYIVSYLITAFILFGLSGLGVSSVYIYLLGYVNIAFLFYKNDPLDPLLWLSFAWEFLFVNYFSGVLYIPKHIDFTEPILYILFVLAVFVIAYYCGRRKRINKKRQSVLLFFERKGNAKMQKFLTIAAILAIIGGFGVAFELFVLRGFSLDGGERRAEFQEALGSFSLMVQLGCILIAGAYFSLPSVFFWGNLRNKILAIVATFALALSAIAIAGKQSLFVIVVILVLMLLIIYCYKIRVVVPAIVKILLLVIVVFMGSYIIVLSSQRSAIEVVAGERLEIATDLTQEFKDKAASILPISLQNTFAEMFGYYGFQLGCFSEQWNINNYPERYDLIAFPPRVLALFPWIERQIIKIFPPYKEIYRDEFTTLGNAFPEKEGYYNLSNWSTNIQSGIKTFGFIGFLIVVFIHGFLSRRIYEHFHTNPSYFVFCFLLWNIIFMVYTIMNGFTGSTDGLFFLLISLCLYWKYKGKEPYFV